MVAIPGLNDDSVADQSGELSSVKLGWETGIEPATVGATVRCSTS